MSSRYAWRRFRPAGLGALLLLASAALAHAQIVPGGELRGDARAQRQLRAVEGRSLTQPEGAALDAMNARRDLLRGRSGTLSPAQRRVERSLDALTMPAPGRAGPVPAAGLPALPQDELPSSHDDDAFLPTSRSANVARSLLERAADGIAAGRPDQARSDLALAEQQLDTLDPADAASLRDQAMTLRRRLTPR